MPAESTELSIKIEPPYLFIVFDRKCDHMLTPWQDAFTLSDFLDIAIKDIKDDSPPDSIKLNQECNQVRLNGLTEGRGKGLVALLFDWTDRLRFSWRSASALRDAVRLKAQDAMLACKGVHLVYNSQGMIQELHNLKTDTIQIVPGR